MTTSWDRDAIRKWSPSSGTSIRPPIGKPVVVLPRVEAEARLVELHLARGRAHAQRHPGDEQRDRDGRNPAHAPRLLWWLAARPRADNRIGAGNGCAEHDPERVG